MDNTNQNNQPPKKKPNWGLIIGLIVGGIVLFIIMVVLFIVLVFYIISKNYNEAEYVLDEYTYQITEDEYTEEINTEERTKEVTTEATEVGYQRVGNDFVGYIDVPDDFVEFTEAGSGTNGTMVQYSDITGKCVVTMNAYDDISADEAANNLYYNLLETDNAVDKDSIESAMVTINGYDSYQIYCYYPSDGKFLVIWCFETPEENDYTHYLAIEFDEEHIDLFDVNETYHPVR